MFKRNFIYFVCFKISILEICYRVLYPVSMCLLFLYPELYLCPVLFIIYFNPVSLSCIFILYLYPVSSCIFILYLYPVSLSCFFILYIYPVSLSCIVILYIYPVSLSCIFILYRYPVYLSCIFILFRYPVYLSCFFILYLSLIHI